MQWPVGQGSTGGQSPGQVMGGHIGGGGRGSMHIIISGPHSSRGGQLGGGQFCAFVATSPRNSEESRDIIIVIGGVKMMNDSSPALSRCIYILLEKATL